MFDGGANVSNLTKHDLQPNFSCINKKHALARLNWQSIMTNKELFPEMLIATITMFQYVIIV